MDMPTISSKTSTFPILGVLGGIFFFFPNFNRTFCKQDPDHTAYVVSDLGLHCLPMSHKKDARIIWVNLHATLRFTYLLQHTRPCYLSHCPATKAPEGLGICAD